MRAVPDILRGVIWSHYQPPSGFILHKIQHLCEIYITNVGHTSALYKSLYESFIAKALHNTAGGGTGLVKSSRWHSAGAPVHAAWRLLDQLEENSRGDVGSSSTGG